VTSIAQVSGQSSEQTARTVRWDGGGSVVALDGMGVQFLFGGDIVAQLGRVSRH
jgi:hypothetical protein